MIRKPKILVMGATGQVGGAVVPYLASRSNVEVVAAARTPDKARGLGVPVVHLDLDKFETIAPALRGVDRIFMATGYTVDMLRQSKDLVNAAKRAGVQQIRFMNSDRSRLLQLSNSRRMPQEVVA